MEPLARTPVLLGATPVGPVSAEGVRTLGEKFRIAAHSDNFRDFSRSARPQASKFGGAPGRLRVFTQPAPKPATGVSRPTGFDAEPGMRKADTGSNKSCGPYRELLIWFRGGLGGCSRPVNVLSPRICRGYACSWVDASRGSAEAAAGRLSRINHTP